jgi:phosphoribosylformylglycinamidine synthase
MLWHLTIEPAPGRADTEGRRVAAEAAELGLPGPWRVAASRGFLVEGPLAEADLRRAAEAVLADPVVETFAIRPCGPAGAGAGAGAGADGDVVHVLRLPGVTDPEAESALAVLKRLGIAAQDVRTVRSYRLEGPAEGRDRLVAKVLANAAVEQAVGGAITLDHLGSGRPYAFRLVTLPLRTMDDAALARTSREGQLSLNLDEMRTIRAHFAELGRDPTDCELETIAQTWSEHCSHKTLKGRVEYTALAGGEAAQVTFDNLLKETIFRSTQELMAECDWLVSVFVDNAGVIRFDDEHDVCIKVETHNHPSAIDPYGGSNTGLGGVIRDVLGTGLAAKPIASTDVFCVAPPDTDPASLPPGVIHPRRVLEGVVAGVRDYGNRMGIPTVNGAVCTHPAFLANPLVFCGTVGVLPRGKAEKRVSPGDRIVAIGGRTGRDGIHGATFSSVELSAESDEVSGGAVQIGNAITEKMVADVLLRARDRGLFSALTDCGAGGFSSAVGEMGADCGAEVHLERAPLKYEGLSYTEIWISEAQERMVLAVPPAHLAELSALCASEGVEATDLGAFTDTGRLVLTYDGHAVGDLDMHFLHEGRPRVVRRAVSRQDPPPAWDPPEQEDYTADLLGVLRDWNVASKEWIIRQYDHEVQARTVLKPLVGAEDDGPGDAAVMQPVRGSTRGLAIGCGVNPRYGEKSALAMTRAVIDEAIRNVVAVGADPDRVAILDNFCWGNPERPETLGALVDSAVACAAMARAYGTPFISGKDSLYNEYTHEGRTLAIPPTLLITAIGIVPDVRLAVTMDLKEAGNVLLVVGETAAALGGSAWAALRGEAGGMVPGTPPSGEPDAEADLARETFRAVHRAIREGLVRSCHDLSEGGLAVALAEMCLAGGLGAEVSLRDVPTVGPGPGDGAGDPAAHDGVLLFSESPSRFVLEVRPADVAAVAERLGPLFWGRLGTVSAAGPDAPARLVVRGLDGGTVVAASVADLKVAWQRPLHADGP